jgi:predicted transcriptional regulator
MVKRIAERLAGKSYQHKVEAELLQGYNLSPVEVQALAQRVQELVDEQIGLARQPGQITYQAVAEEEGPAKPVAACRKVGVHLTLIGEEDGELLAQEGPEALRHHRVKRILSEAVLQGGTLSQEDVALLLGISPRTVKRIFAAWRAEGERLPSRGELQDMGRGVSHKIPVIRQYVQDLSFTQISRELGNHGIKSMARYLRHFALVMILVDRGLSVGQMQSVVGISEGLIAQYRDLYAELDQPAYAPTLERLKRRVLSTDSVTAETNAPGSGAEKGGGR